MLSGRLERFPQLSTRNSTSAEEQRIDDSVDVASLTAVKSNHKYFRFSPWYSGNLFILGQQIKSREFKTFESILLGSFIRLWQNPRPRYSSLLRYWMDEWTSSKLSHWLRLIFSIILAFDRSGIFVKYLELERSISFNFTRFCQNKNGEIHKRVHLNL